jgi:hypothetical protein
MPGTRKGESGWYGVGDRVVRLEVHADRSYERQGQVLSLGEWRELRAAYASPSKAVAMPSEARTPLSPDSPLLADISNGEEDSTEEDF